MTVMYHLFASPDPSFGRRFFEAVMILRSNNMFYTCFYLMSNDRRKHSVDTIACIFSTLEGGTPQREISESEDGILRCKKNA